MLLAEKEDPTPLPALPKTVAELLAKRKQQYA